MDAGENYEVKDLNLAEQGRKNIEWAESQMAALLNVRERFAKERPFEGIRIGAALHPTKETAVLVRTLVAGGADVALCASNPLSTQDDVVAALAKEGVKVWAYKGETKEDYYRYLTNVIKTQPNYTIDDGCDLVFEIHNKHPELISDIIAGAEETTTGVIRLKAMENGNALKYPMFAVNDLKTKHMFDNFLGTGQSTIDGILRATSVLLAGKNFVVCGYGNCGRGIALRARGMDSNVIVCEIDPVRALQAAHDGYKVMPLAEAATIGDIFVTATGNKHVIRTEHMKTMKNGAILANSGHFDVEIDVAGLEGMGKKENVRPFLDRYVLGGGKNIYLIGEGRLCNLVAAEGHPSIVMAQSFCGQALAAEYAVKNRGKLPVQVINVPEAIDNEIAVLQLDALGVRKDTLTEDQERYLKSWEEGT
ncbi:MAG: adenosylhomocysteinase [Candidatus Aenigmarchaeota archaeon]|nr:adenosylhomocysteinase [Candidatus Aenigmarchaeota archaeon]